MPLPSCASWTRGGWRYALRQKGDTLIDLTLHNQWQRFGDIVRTPGQKASGSDEAFLTREHVYGTHLLAHWQVGEQEPWLLATNLPSPQEALHTYRQRMWIEEMFGDLKGHGFNLEDSHLRHFLRLSRLTLAVVLLYVWLMAFGFSGHQERPSLCRWYRADRRDFSVFRIGYNMAERRLTNSQPLSILFIPCF